MKSWQITRKDLKLLVRDRRALVVLVLLPLIFIGIIGLTTGRLMGWTNANRLLKIGFVDEMNYDQIDGAGDRTLARNLVTDIFNRLQKRQGIEVTEVGDRQTAHQMHKDDDVFSAVIVGPTFYDKVERVRPQEFFDREKGTLSGGLQDLDVIVASNDTESSTHSVMEGYVHAAVLESILTTVICNNGYTARMIPSRCDAHFARADEPPIQRMGPQPVKATGSTDVYDQLIPSYTVLFVFLLVNIMARSFIQERDQGTLRRLRLAPVGSPSLLAGKTVPFLVISLIQTLLLFVFGRFLFGMSWGDAPWLLLPVAFCTSVAATALGLLVATVVRTDSQVSAYANTVVITMAGISGCFMPRKWLPEAMQEISKATPHAWSLIAYEEILNVPNPSLVLVVQCCGWLLAFAMLYFVAGTWRFTRTA